MGTKGIHHAGGSFLGIYHWGEKKAPKYLMNNG